VGRWIFISRKPEFHGTTTPSRIFPEERCRENDVRKVLMYGVSKIPNFRAIPTVFWKSQELDTL
jgi:hypothetical protein